jgi:nitroreductase
MNLSNSISNVIRRRVSCRNYLDTPIRPEHRQQLENFLAESRSGPFGGRARFMLAAATPEDRNALKDLGTYGFIHNPTGFIVGALESSDKCLEDYGHLVERAILFATDLGLGTCWLGGSFTKSSFARTIQMLPGEQMPAVVSVGYPVGKRRLFDWWIRRQVSADHRLPWERLFFDGYFTVPLKRAAAGALATPLEMVRLGPSGSNQQPWRIVQEETAGLRKPNVWHFYLRRTPGDKEHWMGVVPIADLQRVDMGIAMCHFELAAHEQGLAGHWVVREPAIVKPDGWTEYTASWVMDDGCDENAGRAV